MDRSANRNLTKFFGMLLLVFLALQACPDRALATSPVSYPANILDIGFGPNGFSVSAPGCFTTAQGAALSNSSVGSAEGADTGCIQTGVGLACGTCSNGPWTATGFSGFSPITNNGAQVLWEATFTENAPPNGSTPGLHADVRSYCPNGGTQKVSASLVTPGFCLIQGNTVPTLSCPTGQQPNAAGTQCESTAEQSSGDCDCDKGPLQQSVGDPINPGSGNLYEQVTDYRGGGPFPLKFTRSYNSLIANQSASPDGADNSIGAGWTTNIAGSHLAVRTYYPLVVCPDPASSPTVYYVCPDPTSAPSIEVTVWRKDGGHSAFTYAQQTGPDGAELTPGVNAKGHLFFYAGGNYRYVRTDGYVEIYTMQGLFQSMVGLLTAVQDPHGLTQNYSYSYATTVGGLQVISNITVTDPSGRQLTVNYDTTNMRISSLTVPRQDATTGFTTINYSYLNGNLTSVTYQDGSVVTYEYNDSANPHALTGLSEQNDLGGQDEYAAWSYDSSGNAVCSEHAPVGNIASTATTCSSDAMTGGAVDTTTVAYGSPVVVTGPTGFQQQMTFTTVDGKSLLASVDKRCRDCSDLSHTITYDINGNPSTITDFKGTQDSYAFDANGNRNFFAENTATSYTRNENVVNRAGANPALPKEITYNAPGMGFFKDVNTCYNFTPSSGTCSDSSSIGPIWQQVTADDDASHTAAHDTPFIVMLYTYNGVGELASIQNPMSSAFNKTTTFTYYSSPSAGNYNVNDLQNVTDPMGHATTVNQYSAAGFPMKVTDMNGVATTFAYDARGRLANKTVDPTGSAPSKAMTIYSYHPNGLLKTVALPITAASHAYMTYTYDRAHRLIKVLADNGDYKTFAYSYNTHPTISSQTYSIEEQRFPNGSITAAYDRVVVRDDVNDRVIVTDGMNHSTTYERDPNGNVTKITDPSGHVTQQGFDPLNRLQTVIDPSNNTTTYSLDNNDHLMYVTSPRGVTTSYIYDLWGNLLKATSPDSGTTSFDYSSIMGTDQFTETDARNHVQTFSVDLIYRVTSQSNGQSSFTYTYDDTTAGNFGIGRLRTATDLNGTNTYSYDSHGNVRKKVVANGNTFTVNYAYDAADGLTQISYPPASGTINYTRDALDRIVTVAATYSGGPTETLASSVTYMPFGPLSGLTYITATDSNRLVETRSIDTAYRLTGLDTKDSTGAHLGQYWSYIYNNDDTIAAITDNLTSGNSQTFGYDAMQRLVLANGPYGSVRIGSDPVNHPELSYDADGNRTQMSVIPLGGNMTTTTYNYDTTTPSERLLSYTIGTNTTTYAYDADGSVTSDGTYTYNYNINERNTKVLLGATTEYQAGYNALGERVSKTTSAGEFDFIYDEQGHLLAELNPNGTILRQHVWLGDRPLAYYSTNINGSTSADVKYLHVDQLNTPVMMTTATKAISWTWHPDPWGNSTTQPTGYNGRFPGQYFDGQTGNMQNGFRDYDPQTGRYLQSDPIGLRGGINTYEYVGSNPLIYSDPLGLWVPMMHNRMTQEAAIEAGHPELAEDLGSKTAQVDDLPGSQDPANSDRHAMSDPSKSPAQNQADYEQYLESNWNQAINNCDQSALANVLHATEDSFAPGHRGLQPWNGVSGTKPGDLLIHFLGDVFANTQTYNNARDAAARLIKKYGECGCH